MLNFKYKDIDAYYEPIIKYAINTCDAFCLTFSGSLVRNEDWEEKQVRCITEKMYEDLKPYLIHQIIEPDKFMWHKNAKGHVFCIFRCCKGSKDVLLNVENFSTWYSNKLTYIGNKAFVDETALPEDLLFLRHNRTWLVTIMHEDIMYINTETEEDIKFFEEMQVPIWRKTGNVGSGWYIEYDVSKAIRWG